MISDNPRQESLESTSNPFRVVKFVESEEKILNHLTHSGDQITESVDVEGLLCIDQIDNLFSAGKRETENQ